VTQARLPGEQTGMIGRRPIRRHSGDVDAERVASGGREGGDSQGGRRAALAFAQVDRTHRLVDGPAQERRRRHAGFRR
jgi:hypothetical protein